MRAEARKLEKQYLLDFRLDVELSMPAQIGGKGHELAALTCITFVRCRGALALGQFSAGGNGHFYFSLSVMAEGIGISMLAAILL